MTNLERAKRKTVNHLRRIRAQVDEIERGLLTGSIGMDVLMPLAKVRGEINGLLAEILIEHIRAVLSEEEGRILPRPLAADLVDLVRRYLK